MAQLLLLIYGFKSRSAFLCCLFFSALVIPRWVTRAVRERFFSLRDREL